MRVLRGLVNRDGGSFSAYLYLGVVERDLGMLDNARAHFRRAMSIEPKRAEPHFGLAALHIFVNDIDSALHECRQAFTLEPDKAEVHVKLGSIYTSIGQLDKAATCYEQALSLDPHSGDANYGLAASRDAASMSGEIVRMESSLASPDVSDGNKILTGFALGRIFEQLGQYDKSFAAVHEANRCQRQAVSYSFDEQSAMFERHKDALGQHLIDYCEPCRVFDETPILVLGMPRSGTSLVEQILASHPTVHGAGEVEHIRILAEDVRMMTGKPFPENIDKIAASKLRELVLAYIQRLKVGAGSASRVIDKLPHNFLRIGLFAALLPNVRIVLCERDPLDNCTSIYQHAFSARHGYASNLKELGEYYKLYESMMSFWTELLPEYIYRVSYEDLVDDTDAEVRKLLQYCGLAFHEDCLLFHKTTRYVSSPSAGQVREAIHDRSVGRGKHYKKHLQPLVDALAK